MPTAVERVFGITELLETILLEVARANPCHQDRFHYLRWDGDWRPLEVGPKTILLSQRVNQTFYSTIQGSSTLQHVLCFKPNPEARVAFEWGSHPKRPARNAIYPILPSYRDMELEEEAVADYSTVRIITECPKSKQRIPVNLGFDDYTLGPSQGSWRRMYGTLVDWAVIEVIVERNSRLFEFVDKCKTSKKCNIKAATLGELVDFALEKVKPTERYERRVHDVEEDE